MTKAKRSGHKKSTAGCANCKRKHIKCDETRPSCVNCITQSRRCPYQDELPSASASTLTPATTLPDDSCVQSGPPSTVCASPASIPTIHLHVPRPPFDIIYVELLQQWLTDTHKVYCADDEQATVYAASSLNQALVFPFLMHGILANAALHLSIEKPDKTAFYRQLANELSSQALSEFRTILPDIDQKSIIAAFLFSGVISAHQMSDCFLTAMDNFDGFIERFVDCMKISRGVSVVIHGWWPYLQSTELSPLLTIVDRLEAKQDIDQQRPEFDSLKVLIRSFEGLNSTTATGTYLETIQKLQRFCNVQSALDSPRLNESLSWAFAWLVNASQEFVTLLEMKRPEALVILAYYAPLLHSRRSSWAVRSAGKTMFQLLESVLGSSLRSHLQWPRDAINTM